MLVIQWVIIVLLSIITLLNFICGLVVSKPTYSMLNKITFILSLILCLCVLIGIPSSGLFDDIYATTPIIYLYLSIGGLILILSVLTLINKIGKNKKARSAISGVYLCCIAGFLYIFLTSHLEVGSFYSDDVGKSVIQNMVSEREKGSVSSLSSPTRPDDYIIP